MSSGRLGVMNRVNTVRSGYRRANSATTGSTRFIQGVAQTPSAEKIRCMSTQRCTVHDRRWQGGIPQVFSYLVGARPGDRPVWSPLERWRRDGPSYEVTSQHEADRDSLEKSDQSRGDQGRCPRPGESVHTGIPAWNRHVPQARELRRQGLVRKATRCACASPKSSVVSAGMSDAQSAATTRRTRVCHQNHMRTAGLMTISRAISASAGGNLLAIPARTRRHDTPDADSTHQTPL
jgi:hypothetical protein